MDMSPAHIHLALNHIPILGPFFLILLMAIGFARRSREILRTSLVLTVMLSATTYGVFLSGESAEHQLEEEVWYDEDLVHEHEERAEKGVVAAIVTGVLALIGIWASRRGAPLKPAMSLLVFLGVLATAGVFSWTALAGGEIRHEEIRPGPESVQV
jgi:hypothetical protein